MKRRKTSCSTHRKVDAGATLDELAHNGVLGIVNDLLDDESLLTVLSHFEPFQHKVVIDTVERTMKQVFGSRWKSYYDAFGAHVWNSPDRLWGLGYNLKAPSQSHLTNAYIVKTVLETLEFMAHNCKDYDVSFIPGEPSNADIDRVWFVENGRLLWVQYHSWDKRYDQHKYHPSKRSNLLDKTGTYAEGCGTAPNFDGQVLLRSHKTRMLISQSSTQEQDPPVVPDFGHELWDIAANPEPRCLWSHYWRVQHQCGTCSTPKQIPASYAYPVTRYVNKHHNAIFPSMQPVAFDNVVYNDRRPFPREHYEMECMVPIRFLEFSDPGIVIDVIHLEKLEFSGTERLMHPTLSTDAAHLGAIIQTSQGLSSQFTLVVWKTELPRIRLIWKDGITGLCDTCHWITDKKWLVVHCLHHGTFAYCLESSAPNPIDITAFAKPIGTRSPLMFSVCGPHNDILVCDGAESEVFTLVKFTYEGLWKGKCIYLRPSNRNWTNLESLRLGLETRNYICTVTRRYILSNDGDVLDLGVISGSSSHDTASRLSLDHNFKVLGIHEYDGMQVAIAVCYQSSQPNPALQFWLVTPNGNRQLRPAYSRTIYMDDIRMLTFSPNGHALYLTPSNYELRGWVITFGSAALTLKEARYDMRVATFPKGPSWQKWYPYLIQASFLAKNFVEIMRCRVASDRRFVRHMGSDSRNIVSFSATSSKANLLDSCRRPQELYLLYRSPRVRWVDILQQEQRDLEYCRSIYRIGTYSALSPDGRFLAYAAHRVPQVYAAPHVELRDLTQSNHNPDDIRRSERSLLYALRVRRDYMRPCLPLDLRSFEDFT